jgi:hypothetical protein
MALTSQIGLSVSSAIDPNEYSTGRMHGSGGCTTDRMILKLRATMPGGYTLIRARIYWEKQARARARFMAHLFPGRLALQS